MEDTTRESSQLIRDIVASKTVEERFLICAAMYEDAKKLARIEMPERLSDAEQEAFLFKKLHGVSAIELVQTKAHAK